jgi:hypothetical protein
MDTTFACLPSVHSASVELEDESEEADFTYSTGNALGMFVIFLYNDPPTIHHTICPQEHNIDKL